ncbi:response regulator [Sulfobacillus thermosulfidooxidans]|uniref:response regulator n=1 Tax=Sulfobacillus thermosulfidooxidans TaxID=28034 RepID=UPI0006B5C9AF|nr:response regulator [Sulfobacillus thermosulfidooxidans]
MDRNDRSNPGGPRVLIVDDTPETRDILRHMVSMAGGVVVATLDAGCQAPAVIQQTPVDIVFLDYQMTGWSGLVTAQHLHVQWPTLPLVMITVMADPATRQAALDAGIRHFLGKPVTVDEIRMILRTVGEPLARGTPEDWAAWVRPFEGEDMP